MKSLLLKVENDERKIYNIVSSMSERRWFLSGERKYNKQGIEKKKYISNL